MRLNLFLVLIIFNVSFVFADDEKETVELTLEQVVDRALQVSFDVANAKLEAKIQSAMQAKDAVQASPKLSASWNYSQYDRAIPFLDDTGNPRKGADGKPVFIRPDHTSMGSILLTQPLTGLVGALAQAMVDGIRKSKAGLVLEDSKRNVAFFAASTYRQVQQAEALYRIAEDRVALAEKQKQEAEVLSKLGRLSKSDFLRLNVSLGQAKVGTAYAKAAFENTQAQLLNLLDYQPDRSFQFQKIPDAKSIQVEVKIPALMEARNAAISDRFELKIAKLGQKEAERSSLLPLITFLPNLSAFVRLDHSFIQPGLLALPTTFVAGFNLDWSLWDGGDRLLSRKILQLQSYKAKNQVAQLERSLSLEILKSRSDLIAAEDVFGLQKSILEQSEEAYRGMHQRFSLGALSVTELLQTENTLNSARVDLMKAVTELDIKNMALQKAMGQKRPSSIL